MITTIQFKTLDDLYQFYNDAIFNGELSECIVNMSRHGGAFGFFAANRWRGDGQEKKVVHEISINPDFMNREDRDWHSTLVHEMCHLWQEDFGRPSRGGYHNSQWADKMIQVGLMPSDTGEAGGKRTGQSITHYIIPGGKFEQVFNTLSREDLQNLRLRYKPTLAAVPTSVTMNGCKWNFATKNPFTHPTIPPTTITIRITSGIGRTGRSGRGGEQKRKAEEIHLWVRL